MSSGTHVMNVESENRHSCAEGNYCYCNPIVQAYNTMEIIMQDQVHCVVLFSILINMYHQKLLSPVADPTQEEGGQELFSDEKADIARQHRASKASICGRDQFTMSVNVFKLEIYILKWVKNHHCICFHIIRNESSN